MKTIQNLILATLLLLPQLGWALSPGMALPPAAKELKLITTDNQTTSLAVQKGEKGTLVVFTCNTCPYSRKWEERLATIGNDFSKKFAVLAVNSNDPKRAGESLADMKKRAEYRKLQFPYVFDTDSALAVALGATRTPEVFLFDSKGILVYHGAIDDNPDNASKVKEHHLRDALAALDSGKPIVKAENDSVGCGIKFQEAKK